MTWSGLGWKRELNEPKAKGIDPIVMGNDLFLDDNGEWDGVGRNGTADHPGTEHLCRTFAALSYTQPFSPQNPALLCLASPLVCFSPSFL